MRLSCAKCGAHRRPIRSWLKGGPFPVLGPSCFGALTQSSRRRIGVNHVGAPLGGAFIADSIVAVFDSSRLAVITLTLDDRPVAIGPAVPSAPILTAVHTDAGWIAFASDSTGQARVWRWDGGPAWTELRDWAAGVFPQGVAESWITGAGVGLLVAEARYPFKAYQLDPKGSVAIEFESFARSRFLQTGGEWDSTRWVGLRLLPLEPGYVWTLADLNSDKRVLVVYDHRGKVARQSLIDAPMGLIATCPTRHKLLAGRYTNRSEVVVYQWDWIPPLQQKEARE